jgi:hypothetical protein
MQATNRGGHHLRGAVLFSGLKNHCINKSFWTTEDMRKQTSTNDASVPVFLTRRSHKTLQSILTAALEEIPMTFLESELGIGQTVCFAIPLTMNARDLSGFLWVYAESRLPDKPVDPSIGFTEDDVEDTVGIYFYKKVAQRFSGEMLPLEALLSQITDLSLRNRIICRVDEMKASIRLDEEFIELANVAGGSRAASFH